MEPLVSVIIPYYNAEESINTCLVSVLNQSYSNFEIILVNDGSNDSSLAICNKFVSQNKKIHHITTQHRGVAHARNTGLLLATGEYIAWVDSDDFISENMLKIMINTMIENNADIVTCGFYKKSNEFEIPINEKENTLDTINSIRYLISGFDKSGALWNKLFSRKLFVGIFFPEVKMAEDFSILYLLYEKSEKNCIIRDILYYYVQQPNSIMKNLSLKHALDDVLCAKRRHEYLINKYPQFEDILISSIMISLVRLWRVAGKYSMAELIHLEDEFKLNADFAKEHLLKSMFSEYNTGKLMRLSFALLQFKGHLSHKIIHFIWNLYDSKGDKNGHST